jgi:hypothetical protein
VAWPSHGERGHAPGRERSEDGVGRDTARNTAEGVSTRNGAAQSGQVLGAESTHRHERERRRSTRRSPGSTIAPATRSAPSPSRTSSDVEQRGARRVASEVDRPVRHVRVGGAVGDARRRTRRSIAGTSVISRAVDHVLRRRCRSRVSSHDRGARRPARARAARPARRRTTPGAGGATTASGPAPRRARPRPRRGGRPPRRPTRRAGRRSRAAAGDRACRCGRRRPSRSAAAPRRRPRPRPARPPDRPRRVATAPAERRSCRLLVGTPGRGGAQSTTPSRMSTGNRRSGARTSRRCRPTGEVAAWSARLASTS